jgi:predicted GNAT superfamily acetyltransferase
MSGTDLVSIGACDLVPGNPLAEALLALNNDHAQELSWLEAAKLRDLVNQAFSARRIGAVDAFLLAIDQSARYDSPNFLWFGDRYPRFVYVDRIVVAESARGRGHARRLYQDLFAQAARAGHDRVVCEVNSRPANPQSDAFHDALGFSEVGRAVIHDGRKAVRYLMRGLSSAT